MWIRLRDVVASALMLVLLSPLLAVVVVIVRLSSAGPVLHRAVRVGRGGRPFWLYKFRSMHVGAAQTGPGVTAVDDARITPIGRWLRKYKIDELPQLVNVLKGEMSLVGPRPEDPRFVAFYTAEEREVLSVRPGITGVASLAYRHEERLLKGPDPVRTYQDVVMRDKLRLELDYLRHRGWLSDLALLARTALAIIYNPQSHDRCR
jgi:lipopolysaccharide/colanic/teichoic acid biosynthesis glycosyltransferase